MDGSIAIARGHRSALSGPDSLKLTHTLRASHDAILVGVGTVLTDDPELRVRLVDGSDPQPVIVDSQLRTPLTAKLLAQPGQRPPWIATTTATTTAISGARERQTEVEARGSRVLTCPAWSNGWVDLNALLGRLHAEGVAHVMVEGGARIITSFLDARLVDYAVITIAPLFLGGLAAVGPLLRSRPSPEVHSLRNWLSARLGEDLVLAGEVAWSER